MRRGAEWQKQRLSTIEAQHGHCASSVNGCPNAARDVVYNGTKYVAFCRSCRLRFDAPMRVLKAQATRQHTKVSPLPGQQDLFTDTTTGATTSE